MAGPVVLPGIQTRLLLDTSGFQQSVSSAVSTATGHMSSLQSASQSAMGVLSGVGNALSGFLIGKALTDLPSIMENAAKGAVAAEGDQVRLKQAVLNTGASWESQSAGIDAAAAKAKAYGFAMGDVRASLANMTATTGSAEEAEKRLQMAMDLSRGTGLDLTTASRLLGKVTDENVNVLARYGIHMEKGADATELFAAIQQKFGGQAEAFSQTATGQMQQYQAVMAQVTVQLGQAFLPILTLTGQFMASVMVPIVQNLVVPALKQIAVWSQAIGAVIKNEFLPIWKQLVLLLVGDVVDATGGVATKFKEFGDGIGAFVRPAISVLRDSLLTIIQVFKQDWSPSSQINGFTNAVGIAASIVRDVVLPAFQGLIGFINDHKDVIAAFAAGFLAFAFLSTVVGWVSAFAAAVAGIGAVVAGATGAIGGLGAVIALLGGPITLIAAAIGLLALAWINDWGGIQEKTQAVIAWLTPYVNQAIATIQQFWSDHGAQILQVVSILWETIVQHVQNGLRIIGDVITIATAIWKGDWSGAWSAISDIVATFWSDLQLSVGAAFSILDTLTDGKLTDLLNIFVGAWASITTAVSDAWNGATGIVGVMGVGLVAIVTASQTLLGLGPDGLQGAWDLAWSGLHDIVNLAVGIGQPGSLQNLVNAGLHAMIDFTQAAMNGDTDSMLAIVTLGMDKIQAYVDSTFGSQSVASSIVGLVFGGFQAAVGFTQALLNGDTDSMLAWVTIGFNTIQKFVSDTFGSTSVATSIVGLVQAGWYLVAGTTKLLLSGDADSALAYARSAFDAIMRVVDNTFGAGTGNTITGKLKAGWDAFKTLSDTVFGAAEGSARFVFEAAMNAFKVAMDPIQGMLDKITEAIGKLKTIMPDWLIPHSPTPFEVGLRGIADAASAMSDAFSGIGGGTDLLKQIGAMATSMGGVDFGRAAMAIMGAETNGGQNLSQIGGTGAKGPFQFDPGGQLQAFAKAMHVSLSEAGVIAVTKPMVAAQWALQGYLGDAIRQGIGLHKTGADLAAYAEKVGEAPYEPLDDPDAPYRRVREWYARLFKAQSGGIFSTPTAVLLGEAGTEGVFNAQQMNWLGAAIGNGGSGSRQPIHVTVQLGGRTLGDAWVEGRTEASRTRDIR